MPRRLVLPVVVALLAAAVLPTSATAGAAKADACRRPPLTVTLLPGPVGTTGPTEFAVTDAVTRRVAIVPRPAGAARDADELDRLRAKAARTDLALYTMYLADFTVPRKELKGFGFGEVTAPTDKTVAAMTIVPTDKQGFREGDTAEVSPFAYDSATTFAPLSLVTNSSGTRSTYAYDGVDGAVEIRELDRKSICLDMNVTFTRGGSPIATIVGTVASPVVKADPSFFYT